MSLGVEPKVGCDVEPMEMGYDIEPTYVGHDIELNRSMAWR